jgi:hypothetical protein
LSAQRNRPYCDTGHRHPVRLIQSLLLRNAAGRLFFARGLKVRLCMRTDFCAIGLAVLDIIRIFACRKRKNVRLWKQREQRNRLSTGLRPPRSDSRTGSRR